MKIRFDTRLVREMVQAEMNKDPAFNEMYHHYLEPVYKLPEEKRGEALADTYNKLFAQRRLGEPLQNFLNQWVSLTGIEEVLIFQALHSREEGAELSRDHTKIGLRMLNKRLINPEQFYPFLNHELMHISDMLDSHFAYHEESRGETEAEERLILQRYRVLWDTYIDGRLARQSKVNELTEEERQREFEVAFFILPRRERVTAFHRIWTAEGLSHPDLLQMACQPSCFSQTEEPIASLAFIPGTLCPLCHFPTYEWIEPEENVVPLIKQDFPTWTIEEGICQRCYECYHRLAVK